MDITHTKKNKKSHEYRVPFCDIEISKQLHNKNPSIIFISTLKFSIIASYLEAEKPTVTTQIYKI
jgi:hypothetical protein